VCIRSGCVCGRMDSSNLRIHRT